MMNFTIYEDGNGGQMVLRQNEILQTKSLATLAYILMFGGNREASTQKENQPGELKFDWWGNDPNENSENWVNSITENLLYGIEISSSSRFRIQAAVEEDVKSLSQYGEVTVEVTFPAINKVQITITIAEPNVKQEQRLDLVWDATRNEIIEKNIL
jgi:hypothetical protein